MTHKEVIEGLRLIEERAKDIPLTAEEWVIISSAKRHLEKKIWFSADEYPSVPDDKFEIKVIAICKGWEDTPHNVFFNKYHNTWSRNDILWWCYPPEINNPYKE